MTATRWWRLAAGTAAGLLVLVALLLTALRLAIAYVPHNEQKLRTWIERQTQMKFEYSRLDARLRWYGPEVVLRDLRVVAEDGSQTLFATREGSVGLDLWNFFRTGQFVAGRVRILEPRVTIVRLADGRIRLLGLRERPADKPPFDFDRLPAGRIVIDDATVVFRDLKSGRAPLELTNLDVQLRRDRDSIVMEGAARLPQQLGTEAEFNVRLKGTLDEFEHLDARVEVEAGSVRLPGLQDFLPAQVARPLAGSGRLHGVFALAQGKVSNLRLDFALRDVALQLPRRTVPPIAAVRITEPRLELAPGNTIPYPTVTKTMVGRAPLPLPAEARYAVLEGDARLRRDGEAWEFQIEGLRTQSGTRTVAERDQGLGPLDRQAGDEFRAGTERRWARPGRDVATGARAGTAVVRSLGGTVAARASRDVACYGAARACRHVADVHGARQPGQRGRAADRTLAGVVGSLAATRRQRRAGAG